MNTVQIDSKTFAVRSKINISNKIQYEEAYKTKSKELG